MERFALLSDLTELAALQQQMQLKEKSLRRAGRAFGRYRARIQERPGHDFGLRADDSRGRTR